MYIRVSIFLLRQLLYIFLLCLPAGLTAQLRVSGRVLDKSKRFPLEAVSVMTNSGPGTITDSAGRFTIVVPAYDSVWFSYLDRPTPKYSAAELAKMNFVEISLRINAAELPRVTVRPPNYHLDSLKNRADYARIFNYKKPSIGIVSSPDGSTGLDVNAIIDMFKIQQNRRLAGFRQLLIEEEKQAFIDHRFSRPLVYRLTGLTGTKLDTFMTRYRPDLLFVQEASDYELQDYIKKSFERFVRLQQLRELLKPDEDSF